jgi:hypothetical protein
LFGQSQSANNQAWVGFKYAGSGSTSNTLSFGFYANNHLVNLRANGNLGIGTDSPSAQLHNYSTATTNVFITGHGTAAQNNWGAQNCMFVKGDNGLLISKANVANNTNRIFNFYNDANGYAQLYMHAGSTTAGVKIQASGTSYFNGGNVGIGTTSPSVKFEVANKSLTRHSSSSWGQAAVANPGDAEVGFVWAAGGTGYPGITSTYTRQWIAGLSPFGTGTDKWSLTNKTLGSNTAVSFNEAGDVAFGTTDITSDLTFGDRIMKIYGTRATLGLFSTGSLSTISMKASNNSSTAMHLNLDGTVGDLAIYAYAGGGELCRFIGASKRFAIQSTTAYSTLQVGSHMASNELTIGGYYYGGGGSINWRSGHPSNSTVWNMARINVTDDSNYNGRIEFKTTTNGGNTGTEPTTKMVLKASGNLGIGVTSPTYKLHVASSNNVSIFEDTSNASGAAFIVFNRPGVFSMGSITRNGSANSVSYNTGSDYRLKEDLKDFNALDLVSNIKAYDYKWKNVDQRDYGFIAHELKQTLPNVVTGDKDGEKMQGVDYSKLTPILLKAIQELEARVKELENK